MKREKLKKFEDYNTKKFEDYNISGNIKEVFEFHYKTNLWGSEESISGPGSTIEYTENLRKEIPQLVSDLGIKVILDAPCGDFNWLGMISWQEEITYIGGDIVEELVKRNQSIYGNDKRHFIHLDLTKDPLPNADMLLCRDCLFHLSNKDIFLVIENFLQSNIRYILTSTFSSDKNEDVPTGAFHFLNLQKEPFNFGEPILLIKDWVEGFPIKYLALWERETLMDTLGFVINEAR